MAALVVRFSLDSIHFFFEFFLLLISETSMQKIKNVFLLFRSQQIPGDSMDKILWSYIIRPMHFNQVPTHSVVHGYVFRDALTPDSFFRFRFPWFSPWLRL